MLKLVEMRYIIRNKETGDFLDRSGNWTRFTNNAQQFPNGWSVPLHLEPLRISNDAVELVSIHPQ
ncbi:MAG: hypothetical protein ACTHMT_06340 [Verrucomicrobiota bacterium]